MKFCLNSQQDKNCIRERSSLDETCHRSCQIKKYFLEIFKATVHLYGIGTGMLLN